MKQLDTQLMHPAEQLAAIIGRIYRNGMTTTSGGNLSILDEEGNLWITPGSVDKGSLTARDIMCVTPDGRILGPHKPSCEYPFHRALLNIRPGMKAVIHAHPPALVSFSVTRTVPLTDIDPLTHALCGRVGYAPYDIPGSVALGEKIAAEFGAHPEYNSVIMENHGIVVCGEDILDAYRRFEALEICARAQINAAPLGGAVSLTAEQLSSHQDAQAPLCPVVADAAHPADERALRAEIVRMVRRACDQELMATPFGTASVRWRGDDFLITSDGPARWDIEPRDIVQVCGGQAEPGGRISRSATALHSEIYRNNLHINAIMVSRPPHIGGFCSSGARFDVRTIPESWIMLKDVPTVEFGTPERDPARIARLLDEVPCVLVANDSVIATGDSLVQAFDRLEVAEFTARSIITATSIGQLYKISDNEVERLRVAFNVR